MRSSTKTVIGATLLVPLLFGFVGLVQSGYYLLALLPLAGLIGGAWLWQRKPQTQVTLVDRRWQVISGQRGRKSIIPPLVVIFAIPAFVACGTTRPDPRPQIIFRPPQEAPVEQPKLPPKQEGAANPCGIPEPILAFVSAGYKGVYNQNMPAEIRLVVNDWTRCAGGRVVNTSRAVLAFEWQYNVETINVSAYGAGYDNTSIGGFLANRVVGAFGAVLNGISVNGSSLGSAPSVNYVQRVTLWFFLTGTNQEGVQQLAFNGRGVSRYLDNTTCGRQCGFENAATRALINMH